MMKINRNIRKTGWLAGLILVCSMPSTAKVYWGVRSGIAYSSLVQKIDLDYWSGACLGYSAGIMAEVPLSERFSLRPEVAFVYEGGSFLSEPLEGWFLLKHRLRNYSLQPSLNVAFRIPLSDVTMFVYAGPAFDYRLWDRISTRKMEDEPVFITEKKTRPFDLVFNSGISVEYKSVFFSINAQSGHLYRQTRKTEGEPSVFQNNLTFSLGYFFR
ncbi:MAG: PorT family protein [Tannerellaceae bacterium]|jgi:hypothetical protein|nr:PorT family protein [Tannerellaceae bacterium]